MVQGQGYIFSSQRVKHENLMSQDLDHGREWKYRFLCSAPAFVNIMASTCPLIKVTMKFTGSSSGSMVPVTIDRQRGAYRVVQRWSELIYFDLAI